MRIFITGATGYIGGMVARKLKNQGHDIIALARSVDSSQKLRSLGYNPVVGDMLEPSAWFHEAIDSEIIIHCAQIRMGKRVGLSWVRKAREADQVVFGALVHAASVNSSCKAVIYTSGISVAGDNGDRWIDENTVPAPGITVGSYHLAGEVFAKRALNEGVPIIIMRPSLPVLDGGTFLHYFLNKAKEGKLQFVGNGENYIPTVHGEDLANAYASAVEKRPIGETFIISDDEPMMAADFTNMLLRECGQKEKTKGAPKWIVSLFAGAPIANLLTSSYRVKNDKAKLLLDWKPAFPTFKESLRHIMLKAG